MAELLHFFQLFPKEQDIKHFVLVVSINGENK